MIRTYALSFKSIQQCLSRSSKVHNLVRDKKLKRYFTILIYELYPINSPLRFYSILSHEEKANSSYTRSKELWKDSLRLLNEGKYAEAEGLMEGARDLKNKASEQNNTSYESEEMRILSSKYDLTLAYIKQGLQKYDEAGTLYQKSLESYKTHLSSTQEYGIALLNYADFVAARGNTDEAIKILRESISSLREIRDDEVLGVALNNISGYLVQQQNYQEAKPFCKEALDIFINKLGKRNDYTRTCYSNYHNILSQLKLEDEIEKLKESWLKENEPGNNINISEDLLQRMAKKLEDSITIKRKGEPIGFVKDPQFYRKEILDFVKDWEERGLDINDPTYSAILEQELTAIKENILRKEELLYQESLKLRNDLLEYDYEWKENLKKLQEVEPIIEDLNEKLLEYRYERAQKRDYFEGRREFLNLRDEMIASQKIEEEKE